MNSKIIIPDKKLTWEELLETEIGTTVYREDFNEIIFIIKRGPGSLCGYIGLPILHPLSKYSIEDLPPYIKVHGGFTYSGGDVEIPNYYFYGWDHGHTGEDYSFYKDKKRKVSIISNTCFDNNIITSNSENGKKWLVTDVIKNSIEPIKEFVKIADITYLIGLDIVLKTVKFMVNNHENQSNKINYDHINKNIMFYNCIDNTNTNLPLEEFVKEIELPKDYIDIYNNNSSMRRDFIPGIFLNRFRMMFHDDKIIISEYTTIIYKNTLSNFIKITLKIPIEDIQYELIKMI